jgi:hypothetical protein
MKNLCSSPKTEARSGAPRARHSVTYHSVVDHLVAEMAQLVRGSEPQKFSPFKLVIIGNRGSVAFSGQIDQEGRMQSSGPRRALRRSDFPANALITDASLAVRTFRIDFARVGNSAR